MKIGDTVYTVNNKTNTVDSWTLSGTYVTGYYLLKRGGKMCWIPKNCVFETIAEAEKVAKL